MKKFFTNLRKNSTENKGFSLVELIIVIAIMVALVAMLAPQFTKYVQKSRDAVITTGAQEVLSMAKAESAFHNLYQTDDSQPGKITVKARNGNGPVELVMENLTYEGKTGDDALEAFSSNCGIDSTKSVKTNLYYEITIDGTVHSNNGEQRDTGSIDVEMESQTSGD